MACGADVRRWETPRVVVFGGIPYVEGMLEQRILELRDDKFENARRGRPNRTKRNRIC